jgi:hypothetical protein
MGAPSVSIRAEGRARGAQGGRVAGRLLWPGAQVCAASHGRRRHSGLGGAGCVVLIGVLSFSEAPTADGSLRRVAEREAPEPLGGPGAAGRGRSDARGGRAGAGRGGAGPAVPASRAAATPAP